MVRFLSLSLCHVLIETKQTLMYRGRTNYTHRARDRKPRIINRSQTRPNTIEVSPPLVIRVPVKLKKIKTKTKTPERKEENVLLNDALNTFLFSGYIVEYMVKDHLDSARTLLLTSERKEELRTIYLSMYVCMYVCIDV